MKLAIIIPTWKRGPKLTACLDGLARQTTPPEAILVVARPDDLPTLQLLSEQSAALHLEVIHVTAPGVIHAENAAIRTLLARQHEGLVAFLDDDAIPPPDWVDRIKGFFLAYPEAAALGGPDIIASEPWSYHDHPAEEVGRVRWYGRVVGNHHRKSQGLREVECLKGVNMVVRTPFLRPLDARLQGADPGQGNGVFWELDLCLSIHGMGGRIFFDPSLTVLHDSNHSHFIPDAVTESTAHNLALVLRKHFPWWRRAVAVLYLTGVGNAHVRGLARTTRDCWTERSLAPLRSCWISLRGACNGWLVGGGGNHHDPKVG